MEMGRFLGWKCCGFSYRMIISLYCLRICHYIFYYFALRNPERADVRWVVLPIFYYQTFAQF